MFTGHPETSLIPYLRGELRDSERESIELHLRDCAACRSQSEGLARTLGVIARHIESLPTPEWTAYRRELRLKLAAREVAAHRWWRHGFVWGTLAASGIAAVTLISVKALHRDSLGPSPAELELADADLGLLRSYPVIEKMDLLENYDVIEHLDELQPASPKSHGIRQL